MFHHYYGLEDEDFLSIALKRAICKLLHFFYYLILFYLIFTRRNVQLNVMESKVFVFVDN